MSAQSRRQAAAGGRKHATSPQSLVERPYAPRGGARDAVGCDRVPEELARRAAASARLRGGAVRRQVGAAPSREWRDAGHGLCPRRRRQPGRRCRARGTPARTRRDSLHGARNAAVFNETASVRQTRIRFPAGAEATRVLAATPLRLQFAAGSSPCGAGSGSARQLRAVRRRSTRTSSTTSSSCRSEAPRASRALGDEALAGPRSSDQRRVPQLLNAHLAAVASDRWLLPHPADPAAAWTDDALRRVPADRPGAPALGSHATECPLAAPRLPQHRRRRARCVHGTHYTPQDTPPR